ncbi:transporter substrate-binding domain-containing protein [Ammoniphilus sp. CFH 90114]|uniref:ATP-binding protein n=1 Tax=Ammoniphilus sp. CFH 90114 TaxID=2493665 RepID=UPI00100DFF0A|nr:transporter substrate-binding domain-containing protein [Ammoniphilus sp. CFH 90114]RXT02796.1 transporter substrate-binding domain-containing protein [Ammoniphilus sp. CFH 90114]
MSVVWRRLLSSMVVIFCSFCLFPFHIIAVDHSSAFTAYPKKEYRIAVEPDLPPFSHLDENGYFRGFHIDLLEAIAYNQSVKFIYVPMNMSTAVEALKRQEIDAIAGMKYNAKLESILSFTNGYFTMSDSVIYSKDIKSKMKNLKDLQGLTIVLEADHPYLDMLVNMRKINLHLAMNQKEALELMMMKRADVLIANSWTASSLLDEMIYAQQYIVNNQLFNYPYELTMAVHRDQQDLLTMFNESLTEIYQSKLYDQLYQRWFGKDLAAQIKQLKFWIMILVGFMLLSFLILNYWNQRLKNEVKKRTQDLELAKAEIERNIAFKEQIFNHVYAGILTFDDRFQLTSMNQRAQDILHISQSIMKASLFELPFLSSIYTRDVVEDWDEKKKSLVAKEAELVHNGQIYHILARLIPLYGVDQAVTGYLLTLFDRTEEKKLQKKLVNQEKMHALGQLVAGIAHEIRNPLTSIKTFIDLLPKKYDNPKFREELLQCLPEATNRMNSIIRDLLDYSRPKIPLIRQWEASEWLESLLVIIRPTLKNKNVKLHVRLEEGMTFYSDPQQLKQVLLNLLLNAMDAVDDQPKKEIHLTLMSEGDIGWIRVEDNGCGIPPEKLDHVFEPFYTSKKTGVGLGLTLCYQWIKENHGDIMIESKLNQGTTMTIYLPINSTGKVDIA